MGTKACKFCYQLNPPQTLVCEKHHDEAIASLTIQRDAAEKLARERGKQLDERAWASQADLDAANARADAAEEKVAKCITVCQGYRYRGLRSPHPAVADTEAFLLDIEAAIGVDDSSKLKEG